MESKKLQFSTQLFRQCSQLVNHLYLQHQGKKETNQQSRTQYKSVDKCKTRQAQQGPQVKSISSSTQMLRPRTLIQLLNSLMDFKIQQLGTPSLLLKGKCIYSSQEVATCKEDHIQIIKIQQQTRVTRITYTAGRELTP